jgi:hypothetical protein
MGGERSFAERDPVVGYAEILLKKSVVWRSEL